MDATADRAGLLSLPQRGSALEVLGVATRLGLTSFGGPIAHLGYFHAEYVTRRRWLNEQTYADLVALCQFLPGPASSQVGIAVGMMRAGLLGGGMAGAALALSAVFAPSFLLVVGALPLWDSLRPRPGFQATLRGINAAVVGLLLAALYHPVWTSAIHAPTDVALGLVDFGLLVFWKWPPWLVVVLSAVGGAALGRL
jgi:chromate transporter